MDERDVGVVEGDEATEFVAAAKALAVGQAIALRTPGNCFRCSTLDLFRLLNLPQSPPPEHKLTQQRAFYERNNKNACWDRV